MYLSCMTLKKRNELNAYCCIPKLFVYKSLNIAGLCSPGNKPFVGGCYIMNIMNCIN